MLEFLQSASRVLQSYINIDFMQIADIYDIQLSLLSNLKSGALYLVQFKILHTISF